MPSNNTMQIKYIALYIYIYIIELMIANSENEIIITSFLYTIKCRYQLPNTEFGKYRYYIEMGFFVQK